MSWFFGNKKEEPPRSNVQNASNVAPNVLNPPPPLNQVQIAANSPEAAIINSFDNVLKNPKIFPYEGMFTIRNMTLDLLLQINSLVPKVSEFISNEGVSVDLLNLEGTCPITFKGVSYNIPLIIWLPENFPLQPPCCYVTPVGGMKIKPRHPHVDPTGLIFLPYLNQWTMEQSNLLDLVLILCSTFSEDPPVYKPADPVQIVQPVQVQIQPNHSPVMQQSNINIFPSSQMLQQQSLVPQQQSFMPQQQSFMPQQQSFMPQQQSVMPQQQSVMLESVHLVPIPAQSVSTASKKDDLINNVAVKITSILSNRREDCNVRINALLDAKNKIAENFSYMKSMQSGLDAQQKSLFQAAETIKNNKEDISDWLAKNGAILNKPVDIDNDIVPLDTLSKQILDLAAEDAAIEDTIYVLERELLDEKIALTAFLKHIRKLSHDQFMIRALRNKVFEKQKELVK